MRVDTSLADSISAATRTAKTPSHPTHKSSSGQSSFKSVLKEAAAATDTTSTSSSASAAETSQAVAGHSYSEILTGPRAGMYLNTTHNKRAGQAFVMVERNGVEYHIYGTGKHRTVVEMKRHTPAPASSTPTTTGGSVTPDTGTAKTTTSTSSSTGTTTAGGTVTAGKITTDTSTL
jgi:hypothetical protein